MAVVSPGLRQSSVQEEPPPTTRSGGHCPPERPCDTRCRGGRVRNYSSETTGVSTVSCKKPSTCLHSGTISPSDVGQLGLAAQLSPHPVDGFGGGVDEIDTAPAPSRRCSLGLGVPDLLDLEEPTVPTAHVVLAEVERGAPSGAFEFATIVLLQDGAVLALTQQSLAGRRKGSGHHGAILNDRACGASVPLGCELPTDAWGQPPKSCVRHVETAVSW